MPSYASVVLFWIAALIFILDFALYWMRSGTQPYVPRFTALGLAAMAAGLALAAKTS